MGARYENITGSTIITDSTVQDSFNAIQNRDPDLKAALEEIAKAVEASGNAAAGPVYKSLLEEAAKPTPDRSRLRQYWDGLVSLAPGVKALAGATAKVMALFA